MKRDPRTVHLSDDIWERLKCEADRQERTLSATLERLLDKALLPCEADPPRTIVRPAVPKRAVITSDAARDAGEITREPVFE